MKFKKTIAAAMTAAMLVSGAVLPTPVSESLCITSEAASYLDAPQIKSTKSSTDTLTVKWGAVSGADGYLIFRYSASKKDYVYYKSTSDTVFQLTDLTGGVTYKFKIAAYIKSGNKKLGQNFSEVVKITTKKLEAPSGTVAAKNKNSVILSWDSVNGADMYRLYKYDSASGKFKKYKDVKNTSFILSGSGDAASSKFKVAALVKKGSKYIAQKVSAEFYLK